MYWLKHLFPKGVLLTIAAASLPQQVLPLRPIHSPELSPIQMRANTNKALCARLCLNASRTLAQLALRTAVRGRYNDYPHVPMEMRHREVRSLA